MTKRATFLTRPGPSGLHAPDADVAAADTYLHIGWKLEGRRDLVTDRSK